MGILVCVLKAVPLHGNGAGGKDLATTIIGVGFAIERQDLFLLPLYLALITTRIESTGSTRHCYNKTRID